MRISNINTITNYKPNFNAKLVISPSAKNAIKNESSSRFLNIMGQLENNLALDSSNDIVQIGKAKYKTFIKTKYGDRLANLNLEIENHNADFYYDAQRSDSELINDFMDAYKYVSHLVHTHIISPTAKEMTDDAMADYFIHSYS